MSDDSELCEHLSDWDDFDGDFDLRHKTAMPFCVFFRRRVTPRSECGSMRCSAFILSNPNPTHLRTDPNLRQSELDLREIAHKICNLIRVRITHDEDAIESIRRWRAYLYMSSYTDFDGLVRDIQEHMALLRRMTDSVRRLGECDLAVRKDSMMAQHVQQHIREIFVAVRGSIQFSKSAEWRLWCAINEYRDKLPRLREVVSDLERAAHRYASI